jgi:hypothetical protein
MVNWSTVEKPQKDMYGHSLFKGQTANAYEETVLFNGKSNNMFFHFPSALWETFVTALLLLIGQTISKYMH